MSLVLSKACCYPWTPPLLHYMHDCPALSFSRVKGTMIKPIPLSLMEKNRDIYHWWMRNSINGLTCLHLLEVREQSGLSPVCSEWAHTHLSASQTEMPKGVAQIFGLQWPSETFPCFKDGTHENLCSCSHIHTQSQTVLESMAIPGNS